MREEQEMEASGVVGRGGAGCAHGRLLRPAASCPRCGQRPALRITEALARDALAYDPRERVGTYQCQRRHCGIIYELTAAAYQTAS